MIELNYRDNRPIYEQVKDSLRKMMLTGAISPGKSSPQRGHLTVALRPHLW